MTWPSSKFTCLSTGLLIRIRGAVIWGDTGLQVVSSGGDMYASFQYSSWCLIGRPFPIVLRQSVFPPQILTGDLSSCWIRARRCNAMIRGIAGGDGRRLVEDGG